LFSIAIDAVASESEAFTCDLNGNINGDSNFNYIYNDANQLAKITHKSDGGTVAEYYYDPSGKRSKKIENYTTTYYIGDHFETKISGSSVENSNFYFAEKERVARRDQDNSLHFYHNDHLGGTNIVTNGVGQQSEKVNYYPYGSIKVKTGDNSKYLFTGQEYDTESGLYYYNSRYYDPSIARFLMSDPITQEPYDPQNLNKYAYTLNNPLKYTDPTGNIIFAIAIPMVAAGLLSYYGSYQMAQAGHRFDSPLDVIGPAVWDSTKEFAYSSAGYGAGSRVSNLKTIKEYGKFVQSFAGGFVDSGVSKISENFGEGNDIFQDVPQEAIAGGLVTSTFDYFGMGESGHWTQANQYKPSRWVWDAAATKRSVDEAAIYFTEAAISYKIGEALEPTPSHSVAGIPSSTTTVTSSPTKTVTSLPTTTTTSSPTRTATTSSTPFDWLSRFFLGLNFLGDIND